MTDAKKGTGAKRNPDPKNDPGAPHNGAAPHGPRVVDVDQLYPFLTSGGGPAPGPPGSGDGSVTPTVENALRDVLGWRPRAQDSPAFTAALAATFKLDEVEDHVVATFTPRGYAMAADLGGVSGGQASLYNRARASQQQMLTLLDGLTPLIPAFDKENGEAYRALVRTGLSSLISELGTAGGPRVPVVNAALRQLIGMKLSRAAADAQLDADGVRGQLGALRDLFGLDQHNVNNVEQEGVRTAFWTLTDLVLNINRAWVALRDEFTGGGQQGFLGTQLVLINRLLSAVAEQLDDLESALDSVYVSAGERETIKLAGTQGLTVDGLLSWIRVFVTEDGPRVARDTGRDGLRTSFMPSLLSIGDATDELAVAVGAEPAHKYPRPSPSDPRDIPPGMRSARVQTAVKGLNSLLWQLTKATVSLTGTVVLFTVNGRFVNGQLAITVHGLNFKQGFYPVFEDPDDDGELRPAEKHGGTREEISADFDWPGDDGDDWPDVIRPDHVISWHPESWTYFARDLPIRLRDKDDDLVETQTRP